MIYILHLSNYKAAQGTDTPINRQARKMCQSRFEPIDFQMSAVNKLKQHT